jgi:demethylmenaquinone methyltransferase/2-methoxy-6-polyprenyl-1,4-benzoquinol methylase
VTRPDLNKQPEEVAAMFDKVAAKYDITNDVLSMGRTRSWRKAVVSAIDPQPGERILDLAAGTGTSTVPFHKIGADAVACDFSPGMIEVGRKQYPFLTFVQGDALNLPFKDNEFDAVTMSFGLRNVHDTVKALSELYRVTKPGGRMVICEFSHPTWAPFRKVYMEYLMKALPAVATKVSSDPEAYVYLADSIREWPDQEALLGLILQAGWDACEWRDLTGGIVALHRAVKAEK